jgi:hypothetical protein
MMRSRGSRVVDYPINDEVETVLGSAEAVG